MSHHRHDLRYIDSLLNEWINLIITALGLGLGMGLVTVFLGNLFKNADYLTNMTILIFGGIIVAVISYLSFVIFIPPVRVKTYVDCKLLYNIKRREFVSPFAYLPYYLAQEAAEQTLLRAAITAPHLSENLGDELRDFEIGSDVLYQLIEHLVIFWLNRSRVTLFCFRPHLNTLYFDILPDSLKQNQFTQSYFEVFSSSVHNEGTSEIIALLPEGFDLIRSQSDNKVHIKGKQGKVLITYHISSISKPTYINHSIPSIVDVPISRDHEKDMARELSDLLFIDITLTYNANLPRWRSIFRRKEFLTFLDWSQELRDDFSDFFGIYNESRQEKVSEIY